MNFELSLNYVVLYVYELNILTHLLLIFVNLDSSDDKIACQKILDKIGLKGYQVRPLLPDFFVFFFMMFNYYSTGTAFGLT